MWDFCKYFPGFEQEVLSTDKNDFSYQKNKNNNKKKEPTQQQSQFSGVFRMKII